MTDITDRYRKIADSFTDRVRAVPADAWDNPAPCEGWVARDVVRHLVEWLPAFFFSGTFEVNGPVLPDVDTDPVAAWETLDGALRAALSEPTIATREADT